MASPPSSWLFSGGSGRKSSIFVIIWFCTFRKKSLAFLLPLYFLRKSSIGCLTAIFINFSFKEAISRRCLSSQSGRSCATFSISCCMAFKSSRRLFFSSSGNSSNASELKTSPFFVGATTIPACIWSRETLLPFAFFCRILIYSSFFCLNFSRIISRLALYSSLSRISGIIVEKFSINASISLANSVASPAGKLMACGR